MVDCIGFEGRRATAVHLVAAETIEAKQIVLGAGVYGSPAILLRSGVGPAAHLRAREIEVVADLPVGEQLRDHPMYTLVYRLKPGTGPALPTGSGLVWDRSFETAKDDLDFNLIITEQPDVDDDDKPVQMLVIIAALMKPASAGTLRLKSRDPNVSPRIDWNLFGDPSDSEPPRLSRRPFGMSPTRRSARPQGGRSRRLLPRRAGYYRSVREGAGC